jgi:hypothetical protein
VSDDDLVLDGETRRKLRHDLRDNRKLIDQALD